MKAFLPPMQSKVIEFLALVSKPPQAGLTLIKHQAGRYVMPFWFQLLVYVLICLQFLECKKVNRTICVRYLFILNYYLAIFKFIMSLFKHWGNFFSIQCHLKVKFALFKGNLIFKNAKVYDLKAPFRHFSLGMINIS